ncbi:hypothetical protein V8C43DRAFT_281602 [Trichoderma afarasin]
MIQHSVRTCQVTRQHTSTNRPAYPRLHLSISIFILRPPPSSCTPICGGQAPHHINLEPTRIQAQKSSSKSQRYSGHQKRRFSYPLGITTTWKHTSRTTNCRHRTRLGSVQVQLCPCGGWVMQISLCSVILVHPIPSHASRFTNGRVLVRESTFYPPPSAVHIRSHHTLSRFIDVG